jgi:hypothetical protein
MPEPAASLFPREKKPREVRVEPTAGGVVVYATAGRTVLSHQQAVALFAKLGLACRAVEDMAHEREVADAAELAE